MLLVFKNFGGKTPRNTKLKNFKIKTQGKLKNTLKIHKNTRTRRKNTKLKIFLENQNKFSKFFFFLKNQQENTKLKVWHRI